jgi:hypothetical protein
LVAGIQGGADDVVVIASKRTALTTEGWSRSLMVFESLAEAVVKVGVERLYRWIAGRTVRVWR